MNDFLPKPLEPLRLITALREGGFETSMVEQA